MDDSKPIQPATQHPAASPCIPPRTRFQLPFPPSLEKAISSFDDSLISLCQRRTHGSVHLFSMGLTFFTAIEFALAAPPTLYALGYDSAAGLCSSVLFLLGIASQIPKKFIHRRRPWMVGRALPIRQDTTSSFPSRAVVCAVTFTWLAAWSLEMEGLLSQPMSRVTLWLVILFAATLTAFARINVGAHYPSDTVLGFLLGCFVVNTGKKFEGWWRHVCVPATAYPIDTQSILSTWSQVLRKTSYSSLLNVTLASYALTLISIQGFWVKCSYVYGLLLSSMAFRVTYVCSGRVAHVPSVGGVSRILSHASIREHTHVTLAMMMVLFFGMLTRGRKGRFRVVTFTIIYFATLTLILSWRLRGTDLLQE